MDPRFAHEEVAELGLHTFTHPNMQRLAPWRRSFELSQTQVAIAQAAVALAQGGAEEEAVEHFEQALQSDIADVQGGTTAEGVHLGAMAAGGGADAAISST